MMSGVIHICIAAHDISGFMAAAYLSRRFPDFRISLLDLRKDGRVAEAGLFSIAHPDIRRFNRFLKIKEVDFIHTTAAAFYMGDRFSGFSDTDYVTPYGDWGTSVEGIDLFDLKLAQGTFTSLANLKSYSFPATLISAEKFLPPDAKGRPVLSDFDYGYQFDLSAYAEMLLAISPQIEKLSPQAQWTGETVEIDRQSIGADVYLDASGNGTYDHLWSDYGFPSGLEVSSRPRQSGDGQPLHVGLEKSGHIEVTVTTQSEVTTLAFTDEGKHPCGRRDAAWVGNRIRLGLSQARLFPISGSPLRSIILDIERLADLMPSSFQGDTTPIEGQEYNRLTAEAYDRLRDLAGLLFATSGRAKTVPESVARKLELFKSRGRVQILDQDRLVQDQLKLVMLGQGLCPARIDPLAALVEAGKVDATMEPIQKLIEKVIQTMPSHSEFIARSCAIDGYIASKTGVAA